MNNIDNVYYINLDKDTDKKRDMLEEFNRVGIKNPVRIPGVYGKTMTKSDIRKVTTPFCGAICTPTIIGCGTSHLNTWKEIIKNNDRYAMVCEDDIKFADANFIQIYNSLINEVPPDFDLIYLGCFGCEKNMFYNPSFLSINNPKTIKEINSYEIREPSMAFAFHCYIISNTAAKKLVDYYQKNGINTHIDVSVQQLARKNLIKRYTITPNLVLQTSWLNINSSENAVNFPIILNKIMKNFELFPGMPLDYTMSCSFGHFYDYEINPWTVIFILLAIVLYKFNYNPLTIAIGFLLLTIPDLIIPKPHYTQYIVSLFILLTPTLIKHYKLIK